MKRILITTILSDALIPNYGLSFAACNFSSNLISGGGFDKVYSILPTFVRGEIEKEAFLDERFSLVYHKWRHRKSISQKLAILMEQWQIFREVPAGTSVWLYNLNGLNALLFVLFRIFKPKTILNVIVLDFTPVTDGVGMNTLYLKLINTADGRICLSNSPLFNRHNAITLPGVVPFSNEVWPKIQKTNKKFLLAGALNEIIAMPSKVLEAFAKMPECELHITGKGCTDLFKEYAAKYPNIIFHGQINYTDYISLLDEVTFVLSTRDIKYPENQCNFPSKIIEAVLHNRIVLSTIDYPQLKDILIFRIGSDANSMVGDIQSLITSDEENLLRYANQSAKARSYFSTEEWYNAMHEIEQIK